MFHFGSSPHLDYPVMSNTNTSFAVLGSGGAGSISPFIVDALSEQPGVKKLNFASRSLPANAELVPVDYDDHSALVEIFKKYSIDVVVSTLPLPAVLDAQKKAAVAAKEAGVKLFVPSEYGFITFGLAGTGNILSEKDEFTAFLTSIGLPYSLFFTGAWIRFIPFFIGYESNQKVNIVGKGETPVSFTAEEDLAVPSGFIAHVTTTLPQSRLSNAHFRIQNEHLTLCQLADRLQKPFVFTDYIPGQEPYASLRAFLLSQFEAGTASTGWNHVEQRENPKDSDEAAGSANHLWEGYVWKKLEDIVGL
ncbi:hypothetical protein D9758_015946 [Tetrapyrgos nigripes]|uniref:NmrA-like domain-containing protein n=1 Tax=Tetrapyrgos nigripes TaxID=182062 RepID=A0A8H5C8H0_9AGAR|nr:hypothetical protein D9758_015946 [Tetrapyrgos nigripes]